MAAFFIIQNYCRIYSAKHGQLISQVLYLGQTQECMRHSQYEAFCSAVLQFSSTFSFAKSFHLQTSKTNFFFVNLFLILKSLW